MMKNAFYFILKTFLVLKIRTNGLIRKVRLIYDVTTLLGNNYNTHIVQYLKFGQVIEYNNRNIFLQKSCRK